MNIFPHIKGCIIDYDVITVGHLKWNRYFNESPDDPPRGDPSTCTSTLITGRDWSGKNFRLIIDPTLKAKATDYYFDVNRRTGLHPDDVTHCFVTHEHFDHYFGLSYFPNALWCAAGPVAELLKTAAGIDGSRVVGVADEFLPGVAALPLPGHTVSLHGVAFIWNGKRIIVAGDGVMTKHHYQYNTTVFEQDARLAGVSIVNIKESAAIVILGHDNLIIN